LAEQHFLVKKKKKTVFSDWQLVFLLSAKKCLVQLSVIEEECLFFLASSSLEAFPKLLTGRTTVLKKCGAVLSALISPGRSSLF